MSDKLKKIGIIQSKALPGDFPRNLRQIVQGYRECLDRGADIVITSIYALSGLEPHDLKRRNSFMRQMEEATETLAAELSMTDVPLITGYCINPLLTPVGEEFDDYWEADDGLLCDVSEDNDSMHESIIMLPCVIRRGNIRVLTEGVNTSIADWICHITTSVKESLPDGDVDLIIHLPKTPWHNRSSDTEQKIFCWESHTAQAPVVCVHPVGTEGGNIYGGGSGLYLHNKLAGLLPYFESACCTLRTHAPRTESVQTPNLISQVEKALIAGIRDTVHQNGYSGVCLPLDHPNGKLLANLCVQALGADNVCGVSFSGAEYPGIKCLPLRVAELMQLSKEQINEEYAPGLESRLKGCLLSSISEEKGMMLLSAMARPELMLGNFTLYGESCGFLAPLGNLYQVDLFLLCRHIAEREPDMEHAIAEPLEPEQDRIIHDLTERNISASDLLRRDSTPEKENKVRSIQRKIIASALKRTQSPLILQFSAQEEQLNIPVTHRLND